MSKTKEALQYAIEVQSFIEAAEKFNVNVNTLRSFAHKNGVRVRGKIGRPKMQEIDNAIDLIMKGYSTKDAAQKAGAKEASIWAACSRLGIRIREVRETTPRRQFTPRASVQTKGQWVAGSWVSL